MRLTQHTDYAFRTLIYLAARPDEESSIADIASHYGISRNHLTKVVQRLAHLGYVETSRGRGGGLRLAKPASEIRLGDVMRGTEFDLALVECFGADDACVITPACELKPVLDDALAAFVAVLDARTVADITTNRRALIRLGRKRAS